MKIWKNTWLDSVLFVFSLIQFSSTLWLAGHWEHLSLFVKVGAFSFLLLMITYNIIVVSHQFVHTAWFNSQFMNGLVSMLNSINIGQSVQAYRLNHVRNHHRYNNDQQNLNGITKDFSSTFRDGRAGEHDSLFQYAFVGAIVTLKDVFLDLLFVFTPRPIPKNRQNLLHLFSRGKKKSLEIVLFRLDQMARFLAFCLWLFISWQWFLFCYLPSFYLALALVNIQNYYEHFGANPTNKFSNSVSYYGRIYNFFAFNDGYHQEHHLYPAAHWRSLPAIHAKMNSTLQQVKRTVSPVPAIIGFLDRHRELLHHHQQTD